MSDVVLRRASLVPGTTADLTISSGRIEMGARPADIEVDLGGRPVLRGLVDQHIHLAATAAASESIDVSPAPLRCAGGLGPALIAARHRRPFGWLRAIGYDPETSGVIDRSVLDAFDVGPVRIQDRSGVTWTLDSEGLSSVLPAGGRGLPSGAEIVDGRPTGRFVRLDGWLRERIGAEPPDLTALGHRLAARGVTTVVDASVTNDEQALALLASARLPQRVAAMTGTVVGDRRHERVTLGPLKVMLDDDRLPSPDELAQTVRAAHARGRSVAVHCVTPAQLVVALVAGIGPGDRVEHGSIVLDSHIDLLAASGATVVTQPGLVRTRGDRYLREVAPDEQHGLYRVRRLLDAGVPMACGSDAPYGPLDPWVHIAAAVDRMTAAGVPLGADEAIDIDRAIGLWQAPPCAVDQPAETRAVSFDIGPVAGSVADLIVLDVDWNELRRGPERVVIHSTWIDGVRVFSRSAD